MREKKPVTTKRGQHHKYKSFRINLVKDATLEKIDSNRLRNNPETFEKKKVTFEKRNSDPLYFRETLCNAFPYLQGNEFSLWRLECTNTSKETKTSLIPLPSEIDNAVALCNCEELNRSCLYIKLQAAPTSHPFPSPQPHPPPLADEDDSVDSVSSSPPTTPSSPKMSTVPDLLPSSSSLFGSVPLFLNPTISLSSTTHESPILTFVQTTQNSDEHHIQPLASQPWLTVATSDINQTFIVPLNSSVPLSQQPSTSQYYLEKDNQLLDMTSKVQVPSNRDTENRHPKKRKFLPEKEKNCEPTAYPDAGASAADYTDDMEEPRIETKTTQLMSLGLLPNDERAASYDVGSQQPTAPMSLTAFLIDDSLTLETAQQARSLDISYPNQTSYPTFYPNHPVFLDLQNNVNEASRFQASAQQWSDINSTSANAPIFSWQQDGRIQTSNSLGTDPSEVIITRSDYMTQEEMQMNLLRRHMDFLVDRIDPDFGLLDVMIARKDLTMAEFHQIRSMPSTVEERNRKLLNYIINKNKAGELITALAEAGQMHLANYLNSLDSYNNEAECKEAYLDIWPISEILLEKLISNRQALIDGLDSSYLSYKLYFKDVINKRQHEFILSKPTNSEKNEALLEILGHGSIQQYKQTIESLQELNQDRILKVLGEAGEGREQMQIIEQQLEQERKEKEELTKQLEHERKVKEQLVSKMQDHRDRGQMQVIEQQLEQLRKEKEELSKQLEHKRKEKKRPIHQMQDERENLQIECKFDPVLVHTIRTGASEQSTHYISALTILDKELFVQHDKGSEFEVYDLMKFTLLRQLHLKEVTCLRGIDSCNINKCLYILNYIQDLSCEILRVDANGKLIKRWSIVGLYGYSLSVTHESNLILIDRYEKKLKEYSPDGQLICKINLSARNIRNPRRAIKLTNGNFVVSYDSVRGKLHGVCIIDRDGKVQKSFSRQCESTSIRSTFVFVDGNGFMMVGDFKHGQVLLLDSDLGYKGEILAKENHGLKNLGMILVDELSKQLFVADTRNQRVLVFDWRKSREIY